jgi:hypothetical protein
MVDLNGNGMSDVWEWVYSAYGINPNSDSDGDGFSNLQEVIAGTNPFDSNSYPHIPVVFSSPTNFSVMMPYVPGKLYLLQSITNLGSTNWIVETNVEAVSGTNATLTVPTASEMKFYRVAIADVDSDGSGLMNDWGKNQLGLNPTNAWSNVRQYGEMFGGNPVGTNPEITSQLGGENPKHINFLNPEAGLRVNDNGELMDAWGTPFFFHQISSMDMEIHSAGPDRIMWTVDDLVAK